jgi:hypothetical protein
MTWALVSALAQITYTVWIMSLSCALLGSTVAPERIWRALAAVHQELWLFAPPGMLVGAIEAWNGSAKYLAAFSVLGAWNWWYFRNWPDENRWQRRSRKAKEAVAERAGRLVVVPEGGSA